MFTLPFWIALILSLASVQIVRRYSLQAGVVAAPRKDRWHSKPTPKIGGVGIFFAFAVVVSAFTITGRTQLSEWGLIAGATIMFALGLYDDFKQISPPAKLIVQILAAAIVVFFGRTIGFFPWELLNILFTFVWLVGITNAINLLDNMDGLAGGVSLIAAGLLSYLFWQIGMAELMFISMALSGVILGFLFFNFPPAKIFMGDSGSLFLGFTLAALAIARVPRASNVLAVMGVPTMLFLLPILDTTMVTVTRILRGQSPTRGGRDHTSHRLIAFGLSERQTVLALYTVALVGGVIGTALESLDYEISLLLIPILLIALTLFIAYLGRLKVVEATTPPTQGTFTRLMVGLTWRGRLLEIALDFILISLAYYLAFWIHFGLPIDTSNLDLFLSSLPIALAGSYISFFLFGIYRGVWQYIGLKDLIRFGWAMLGAILLVGFFVPLLYPSPDSSWTIYILFGIFLLLGLGISRSSFKIFDQYAEIQTRNQIKESPILIFGADDPGETVLRVITQTPDLGYHAVGFLDDNPYKWSRQIHGVSVLGNIDNLEQIILRHQIEGIILTSSCPPGSEQAQKITDFCNQHDIWMRRLRVEFDLVE
jgi:UDP-GlcNAc:undecaprenyl-phosphate GlcNAc-1-phosphate transferase